MSAEEVPSHKRNFALVLNNKKILFIVENGIYKVPNINGLTDLEEIGKFLVKKFDIYGKYKGTLESEQARIFVFHSEKIPKNAEFLSLNKFLGKELDSLTAEVVIPDAIRKGFLN